MQNGRVRFFNVKSKFGFITSLQDGREYYVHVKDLNEEIAEGDEVVFEIETRKRGPAAVNVSKKKN